MWCDIRLVYREWNNRVEMSRGREEVLLLLPLGEEPETSIHVLENSAQDAKINTK